jgi:predicted Rossmann fold nucleotide-binding protein DprA/Smf involved in DNA uptake
MELLADRPSFEELLERTETTAAELASLLAALEIRGLVRSLPGRRYEQRA